MRNPEGGGRPRNPEIRGNIPSQTDTIFDGDRRRFIHDIGLGELTALEVKASYDLLRNQMQIGLNRQGPPTTLDGGLLAIRTGIPSVTSSAWERVPVDASAYVADIAGTNWNIKKATKQEDGSVALADTSNKKYNEDRRHVTFDEFVSRIAYPIAGDILNDEKKDEAVDIGIALGFPHENKLTPNGIDAHLLEVKEDGEWTKKWKITDWDPEKHTNITAAISKKLKSLGINVRTLVAINDTPAVGLDGGAIQAAEQEGFDVISAAFIGGTGTNGALKKDSFVNLEVGRAEWPSDKVFERMKQNGWVKDKKNKMELETGEALCWRLAAGMQLLHEYDNKFVIDQQLYEELTPKDPTAPEGTPDKDPELISLIASGERSTSSEIQSLAQNILTRAGQVYGATLAAMSGAMLDAQQFEKPKAFLAEGGTLLNGYGVKEKAEQTAADLGQQFTIKKASGLRGVGTLAMTYTLAA